MKICLIGDCGGHIGIVFESSRRDLEFVGAATCCAGETMEHIRRHALHKGHDIPLYDDWQAMLNEVKPDIVAVDTVFSSHAQVAEYALKLGCHVYTEKPVATEMADLERLEAAAEKTDKTLFAMLTLRFDPWFYTAKRLVDAGAVGRIQMITAQKSYKLGSRPEFYKSRETYGGTIPWVSIHMIDQILWITGKRCQSVSALHSSMDNHDHGQLETAALITLSLEDGVMAAINTDYRRPGNAPTHGDDRIRIAGAKGVLEVMGNKVYLINAENDGMAPIPNEQCENIFDGFLKVCEGACDPIYAGHDGLYATRVALSARAAADSEKTIQL